MTTAANTLHPVSFLAIAFGWLILGETVHPAALAGGLLALIDVATSRSTPRRHIEPDALATAPAMTDATSR